MENSIKSSNFQSDAFDDFSDNLMQIQQWFNQTFPECTIRINTNFDVRVGALKSVIEVFTSKEMTPENQGFMKVSFSFLDNDFKNGYFESAVKQMKKELKKNISNAINMHYRKEKARVGNNKERTGK